MSVYSTGSVSAVSTREGENLTNASLRPVFKLYSWAAGTGIVEIATSPESVAARHKIPSQNGRCHSAALFEESYHLFYMYGHRHCGTLAG